MNKKRKVKPVVKYILYVVIAVIAIAGILQWRYVNGNKEDAQPTASATAEPTPSAVTYLNDVEEPTGEYVLDDATIQSLRDEIAQDKAVNQDIKGVLYFESGLIHKAVLQGTDNSYYIYHQWEDGSYGPTTNGLMLDYQNNLDRDEMNTIMYGHYWYSYLPYGADYGMTQLSKLIDQANYEANKYVAFVTENDIRYYIVARAFNCPLESIDGADYPIDNLQYNLVTYDSDYFQTYMDTIRQYQYYDTGVEVDYGDHLLTMQTCLENDEESREVVICKELGRKSFN